MDKSTGPESVYEIKFSMPKHDRKELAIRVDSFAMGFITAMNIPQEMKSRLTVSTESADLRIATDRAILKIVLSHGEGADGIVVHKEHETIRAKFLEMDTAIGKLYFSDEPAASLSQRTSRPLSDSLRGNNHH
jgi:hypothetical protein